MIKHNGTGFINQTGYGVMKLGNKPTLKPQFSLLTDEHFENIDAERKYKHDGSRGTVPEHRTTLRYAAISLLDVTVNKMTKSIHR